MTLVCFILGITTIIAGCFWLDSSMRFQYYKKMYLRGVEYEKVQFKEIEDQRDRHGDEVARLLKNLNEANKRLEQISEVKVMSASGSVNIIDQQRDYMCFGVH